MLKSYCLKDRMEAGCDEAGRGCLAGPVFAAAVILDPTKPIEGLNDSKKLSHQKRALLRLEIEEKALSWAVYRCSEQEIDRINILNASIKAMQQAVLQLAIKPEHLLIDGNRFKPIEKYEYTTVIKGDGIYASIAAASILAKTHRDAYMCKLANELPVYGFDQHKGYATKRHIQAIIDHGYTRVHRKSFNLKQMQLELFS